MLSVLQGNILHYRWAVILHFLGQRMESPVVKQHVHIGTV